MHTIPWSFLDLQESPSKESKAGFVGSGMCLEHVILNTWTAPQDTIDTQSIPFSHTRRSRLVLPVSQSKQHHGRKGSTVPGTCLFRMLGDRSRVPTFSSSSQSPSTCNTIAYNDNLAPYFYDLVCAVICRCDHMDVSCQLLKSSYPIQLKHRFSGIKVRLQPSI